MFAVADPAEVGDPGYAEGLRAAVAAAIAYAIDGIEAGELEPGPIPAELFAQARAAASARVPLDTVLRRYVAGHALIADFAMCAAEANEGADGGGPLALAELQRALRTLAALVDRLIAAVSEQYRREAAGVVRSPDRRRTELIRRLLVGEQAEAAELGYELEGWHLGVLASGHGAKGPLRRLAERLDRRLLTANPRPGVLWAWLGGRGVLDPAEALARLGERAAGGRVAGAEHPGRLNIAFGEPAKGLDGWRLTHRQALAALPVAERGSEPSVLRYADVALLASAMRDEVLAASLRRLYLEPLEGQRDGGATLRATLRAYFGAERNVSSTAAALGIDRKTVAARLRTIEARLGRPVAACMAELETAVRLWDAPRGGQPVPESGR